MKRSITLCLAALLLFSGCTDMPSEETAPTKETSLEQTLSEEEQAAIRYLPVYQRDLEALAATYNEFHSKVVRDAVLEVRAREIIRLLGEANTRRKVDKIEQQMIPEEAASAKNALLDKKATFR